MIHRAGTTRRKLAKRAPATKSIGSIPVTYPMCTKGQDCPFNSEGQNISVSGCQRIDHVNRVLANRVQQRLCRTSRFTPSLLPVSQCGNLDAEEGGESCLAQPGGLAQLFDHGGIDMEFPRRRSLDAASSSADPAHSAPRWRDRLLCVPHSVHRSALGIGPRSVPRPPR